MSLHKERLKFILAVVLYGTIGMFLRFTALPSEAVAFYRGLIGALFILLYRTVRGEKPDLPAIRRNLRLLLLSGFNQKNIDNHSASDTEGVHKVTVIGIAKDGIIYEADVEIDSYADLFNRYGTSVFFG